jgi:hypothetical protein
MSLYTFLYSLLNVLVQIANKIGLQKQICGDHQENHSTFTLLSSLLQVNLYVTHNAECTSFKLQWSESASELYRPRDRRLSEK